MKGFRQTFPFAVNDKAIYPHIFWKNCFHSASLTLVPLSEERAEDIKSFFGTAGYKLSTKTFRTGTLWNTTSGHSLLSGWPTWRGGKWLLSAGVAYIAALIFLHFHRNLTGWNALKTPPFGDPDTEFEKSPVTLHSITSQMPPNVGLPINSHRRSWLKWVTARVTLRATGSW